MVQRIDGCLLESRSQDATHIRQHCTIIQRTQECHLTSLLLLGKIFAQEGNVAQVHEKQNGKTNNNGPE